MAYILVKFKWEKPGKRTVRRVQNNDAVIESVFLIIFCKIKLFLTANGPEAANDMNLSN